MPTIQFWFEYGSTYTYLSVMRIAGLASARGVAVDWRPFLLMPILAAQGMNQGPFLPFPSKLRYMWRDLERRAQKHGLPYHRPSTYPPNTLLTARIGVLAASEGWCQAFTERTFELHWGKDQTIGTEGNLQAALTSLGKDVSDVVARAQTPENKEALRLQTERAQQLGVFGSPSFVVGEELFWGDDRLEEALDWAVENRLSAAG